MVRREKRLRKVISSLEKQKKLHKIKRERARELGKEELVRYYTKEIESFEEKIMDKESKLKRK